MFFGVFKREGEIVMIYFGKDTFRFSFMNVCILFYKNEEGKVKAVSSSFVHATVFLLVAAGSAGRTTSTGP